MRECPSCGAPAPNAASRCHTCGSALPPPGAPRPAGPARSRPPEPRPAAPILAEPRPPGRGPGESLILTGALLAFLAPALGAIVLVAAASDAQALEDVLPVWATLDDTFGGGLLLLGFAVVAVGALVPFSALEGLDLVRAGQVARGSASAVRSGLVLCLANGLVPGVLVIAGALAARRGPAGPPHAP